MRPTRRSEREADRNLEEMWLLGWIVPDRKTISDVRKDNGTGLASAKCVRILSSFAASVALSFNPGIHGQFSYLGRPV